MLLDKATDHGQQQPSVSLSVGARTSIAGEIHYEKQRHTDSFLLPNDWRNKKKYLICHSFYGTVFFSLEINDEEVN